MVVRTLTVNDEITVRPRSFFAAAPSVIIGGLLPPPAFESIKLQEECASPFLSFLTLLFFFWLLDLPLPLAEGDVDFWHSSAENLHERSQRLEFKDQRNFRRVGA